MVSLPALWLPILLSAVAVFILSNLLWMALPFWHQKVYGQIANQKPNNVWSRGTRAKFIP